MVDFGELGFGGNSDAGMEEASAVVLADTTTLSMSENFLPPPCYDGGTGWMLTVVPCFC